MPYYGSNDLTWAEKQECMCTLRIECNKSKNTHYLWQVSNLQIEADNKCVPAHPEDQPYCILKNTDGHQIP